MKLLLIGKSVTHPHLDIEHTTLQTLPLEASLAEYDYLILSGGDGLIRRTIEYFHHHNLTLPPLILHPTGSFNVISKYHKTAPLMDILERITEKKSLQSTPLDYYTLNEHIFLFSAGNMNDLQHIFLAEHLRFGILKKGAWKYLLSALLLLPYHLLITPFLLSSQQHFAIFTPLRPFKKWGNLYGEVKKPLTLNLGTEYQLIQLDGDIVTLHSASITITPQEPLLLITA
jgi:hypothetical protein